MNSASDLKFIRPCLSRIIDSIGQCQQKLKNKKLSSNTTTTTQQELSDNSDDDDYSSTNVYPNMEINKITLDKDENKFLNQLTEDIASILDDCLPHLSSICSDSFVNFLHKYYYNQEKQKFSRPLTKNVLVPFRLDMKALQASCEAFPAASTGQLLVVKDFLEKYPIFKNRPSLWGTTLLYEAARNNQFEILKYLLEKVHCAVNAQNWTGAQDDESTSSTNPLNVTLGSTALHGACLNDHLRIVKYLVEEKEADHYIRNEAGKTPINYGEQYPDIKQFFQKYLELGYSAPLSSQLPNKLIAEENELQQNCIWEYKPLLDRQWYTFSADQADILHQALLLPKQFQPEVQLKMKQSLLNVSMTKFFQSDNDDPHSQNKQAWIRCRGSSVLNFGIQAVWQLLFEKYPKAVTAESASLLKVSHLTTNFDSTFNIELNKWYTCDARTNSVVNNAMNYRQVVITTDIHLGIQEQLLTFNLHTFMFSNNDQSVLGYLRWIPKLITNNGRAKNNNKEIDNFQSVTDREQIVLSREHLQQDSRLNSTLKHKNIEMFDDDEEPTNVEDDQSDEDDNDEDNTNIINKKKSAAKNKGIWSVNDIIDEDSPKELPHVNTNVSVFPEYTQPPMPSQPDLSQEERRKLNELMDRLNELQKQLDRHNEYEQTLNEVAKQIITKNGYTTNPVEVMENFLLGKAYLITIHLNTKEKLSDYYVDKIPKLFFNEQNKNYVASLTGLKTHHHEFELVLQRVQQLSYETQRTKHNYERQLVEMIGPLIIIITKRIPSSQNWKYYSKYFLQILKDKKQECIELFDEFITKESKLLTDETITHVNFQARTKLEAATNQYLKSNPFATELEKVKQEALDEFIKEQILLPRLQLDAKPSEKSVQVLNMFVNKKKREMKTESIYKGFEFEQFKLVSKLLRSIMLYYHCFQTQLPLFESAQELTDKVHNNTVVTISTSTGSGKSTLLPALLIAEGYDRVLVTQPRRLPCASICERVNETMTSKDDDDDVLAGWAVSGVEHDINSPILYLTDGLLREQLLHDESLITDQTKLNKSVVFFLDEVHERSINIDLCLALLARLLTHKPHLKTKMKLIISSATLDTSVPTLFRQIKQLKFEEFTMPKLGTLYPVTKHERPNDNIISLVQELNKKRRRDEQILCFVNSVADVHLGCRLLLEVSSGAIIAYPLVQSQSATEQQMYIEQGSIFFSTTVAETSLTFPCLRYVIDTGMINMPIYDLKTNQTILKQIRAAESTIKQRLGRLGRTQPGDYYSLYNFEVAAKKFPTPQICQSELTNIELSLRKSPVQEGLNHVKEFLPDKPPPKVIDLAIKKLIRFGVLTESPNEHFTKDGVGISKLPDFDSVEMSKSIYYALIRYRCGQDLIIISSILSVLNTSALLKSLPNRLKTPDGDFMTLLNVMNEILNAKQSMPMQKFKLKNICQAKGLEGAYHTLNQACRRYETLERAFNLSNDYRNQAQIQSGKWELIAKALLKGYSDNVFVSLKELQGRTDRYTRYRTSDSNIDVAVLDNQSTLNRSFNVAPVSLVVARDIRYASAVRAMAVLSFVGEIKSVWIEYEVERKLKLNDREIQKLNADKILENTRKEFPNVHIPPNNQVVTISGASGQVLNAELYILQKLVEEMKVTSSSNLSPNSEEYQTLKRNLAGIMKMTRIFNPLKWRWENQEQVIINIEQNPTGDMEVTIKGRNSKNQLVQEEFQASFDWLKNCVVIRTPNSGVPPKLLIPQVRHKYLDIEEKISHITDSKRTEIDLWNGLKGPKSSRETRMEVVAWIAVCRFGCKLEGGFIRDWIVGNYIQRPTKNTNNPSQWVTYHVNAADVSIPSIDREVVPADLDCHLPVYSYFDIDKFLDYMHKYQIECTVARERWRYILLFDEHTKTGPFTMDLIEPHVALTHDRIDFDVNNLSLEKDATKELGMRVDIEREPYSIPLEKIVNRIRHKELQILRPIDEFVKKRLDKMITVRGWTPVGRPMHVIPNPPSKYRVVLVPLPPSFQVYTDLVKRLQVISNIQIQSIEEIKNPSMEALYYGMQKPIASQCKDSNPNETELFHGTKNAGINGIRDYGYDDRLSGKHHSKGDWGHGTYFSDNPLVSHGHTQPNKQDKTRVIYYNKVLLGNVFVMNKLDRELQSAPMDFHSVHGIHDEKPNEDEYIVYRYGQALPYLKITYTV